VIGARSHSVLITALGLAVGCGPEGAGKALPEAGPQDLGYVTGCLAAPPQPTPEGGYYVNGNTICTADSRIHLFHGVDRPSLEWSSTGRNLSPADFRLMASWNANVVRIALNQDFWLADSPLFDSSYATVVDAAVAWAEAAGMDVILDLHWSDAGVLGGCSGSSDGCQQQMPDANSITFWSDVAARYRDDGRVLFELYNEPHDVSWSVWKSGGHASDGFQAVGMQELYNTVRATGAQNLVIIGGLDWAYDLSGVPANRIDGYNILYATHPYNALGKRTYNWEPSWGFLTERDPVIVTEFGELDDTTCATDYSAELIQYADLHATSWTAWAWFPGGCTFPAIIDDWSGTPSPTGAVVKRALLGYADPPASPPGSLAPDINDTFDRGVDGWVVNNWDNPDFVNLGARVPDGGSPPMLRFVGNEGDPNPGALEFTLAFTASDQYAIADVAFAEPGRDLSGRTLHARVRLVSGSFAGGAVLLYACSPGPVYICTETPPFDAARLTAGTWVPLTLDLGMATEQDFDASKILEIGVEFLSAAPSIDGGGFVRTGDVVFEIDTVTD
jgi:endoglucanase